MVMRRADRSPFLRQPLFLQIWAVAALSMAMPALHALVLGNLALFRVFFTAAALGLVVAVMVALARSGRPRNWVRSQLLALLATFAVLPLYLALPLYHGLGTTSFMNAYFDMVSAITTTGANIYDDPARLDPTLHLWRAQVGWMGGLFVLIAAAAILGWLSLGGFEVTSRSQPGRAVVLEVQRGERDPRLRLLHVTTRLAPLYAGLTALAWMLLYISGDDSLVALCHAMSVMATSGISPVGGIGGAESGIAGEMMLFLFMFLALSRLTLSGDTAEPGPLRLIRDPEFRLGLLLVVFVSLLLFLRHFLGAWETAPQEGVLQALRALWGALFTVMSFLTTTGFVSDAWEQSRLWSGLETPGMILLGLALIGGGVATTAGGVKLLRVYVLYLAGLRELQLLAYPSSVAGRSQHNPRIRRSGIFITWLTFMLFALTLALLTVVLAAMGIGFDQAVVLAVATLSTTGPLIEVAGETPLHLIELGPAAKAVLCAAMVLGRLEMLAIIALFAPSLWRQ